MPATDDSKHKSQYTLHKGGFSNPHFAVSLLFPATPKMFLDANTQRHTTEKTSTPTLDGIVVTHAREPSLSSRLDEEELDRHLARQQFSEVSLGLNTSTVSAAEKTFRREEYIYVGFFLYLWFFKMMIIPIIG